MGHGDGPPNARVLIVGECWGQSEHDEGRPFVGESGRELNRMLEEAGMSRSECFCTNVVNARPPYGNIEWWVTKKKSKVTATMKRWRGVWVEPVVLAGFAQLLREISLVRPNVIVAAGGLALLALTGAEGILKWRGSQLMMEVPWELWPLDLQRPLEEPPKIKLIPTVNPAAVLREWSLRNISVLDLKRAAKERATSEYTNIPKWDLEIRPSFDMAFGRLSWLLNELEEGRLEWIDFDIETKVGHIDCAGLSWSRMEAICIPFMCREDKRGYWLEEFECKLVWMLYKILTHPKVKVRGQNLLYDCQYTYRHWHFVPRVAQDTMISHHSAFCELKKSLDFQASMYCDYYRQWKPDKAAWKVGG